MLTSRQQARQQALATTHGTTSVFFVVTVQADDPTGTTNTCLLIEQVLDLWPWLTDVIPMDPSVHFSITWTVGLTQTTITLMP